MPACPRRSGSYLPPAINLTPFQRFWCRLLIVPGWILLAAAFLQAALTDGPPSPLGQVYRCAPGPWGELEYSRIVIEPPDEFLSADYHAAPTRWAFPGFDDARLEQLWREASLDPGQLQTLRNPQFRESTATAIILHPPEELVRSLSPEARAVIYNTLARLPGNPLQEEPFRFRAEMVNEWFADSGLRDGVVAAIRNLLYRRGNSQLFSDPALVLPLLPSPAERVQFVKTLSRKSTLLLKVRVRPDSDLDTMAVYWGAGRRSKDVKPLLHSLARHPGGMTIDVVHLLPRFARGLLYTYPSPAIPRSLAPDCHWTSMNFFNETPDGRFDDILQVKRVLTRDYTEIKEAPAMGDLLLLSRPDGEVLHSCTYVAADIVFTKNGQSHSNPWTLTTLPDLQAFYPSDPPLTVRVFRHRDAARP